MDEREKGEKKGNSKTARTGRKRERKDDKVTERRKKKKSFFHHWESRRRRGGGKNGETRRLRVFCWPLKALKRKEGLDFRKKRGRIRIAGIGKKKKRRIKVKE